MFRRKALVLFIVCFGCLHNSFGQFFGLRSRKNCEYINVLRTPNDDKIRVVAYVPSIPSDSASDTEILVFDSRHNLVDSIRYPRGISPGFRSPVRYGNKLYWSVWMRDTNNWSASLPKVAGAILVLDTNLKFILLKRLTHFVNLVGEGLSSPLLLHKTNFLFYAGLSTSKLYKVDHGLVKYDSIKLLNLQDLTFGTDGNVEAILDGNSGAPSCAANGGNRKVVLDSNFNIQDCFAFENVVYSSYFSRNMPIDRTLTTRILRLSKTRYFVSGSHQMNDLLGRTASVNAILSPSNTLLRAQLLFDQTYDLNYLDMFDCAVYDGRFIMTTGCRGRQCHTSGAIATVPGPSEVYINKLDTMGNIIWEKEYGGDMFYGARSIALTPDSGAVIAGLRYDSTTHTFMSTSFLLHLDKNGNILDGKEGIYENSIARGANCFPNPTSGEIIFQTDLRNVNLSVTDISGRELLYKDAYDGKSIDLCFLQKGLYFFRLSAAGITRAGKFYKE
jgi:hypothetical protein